MSRKAGAESGRVTRRRKNADGETETTAVGLRAEPAVSPQTVSSLHPRSEVAVGAVDWYCVAVHSV